MTDGQVLEFSGLTKRFGTITAVNNFTARVEPGIVTGFLGPNGAGKTTTLRMLLGLVSATSGTALIGGQRYRDFEKPLQSVGSVLEASSFHPGRSAANHLKVYAHAAGLPTSRIDETLALVGLTDAAGRRVGGYSLGMRQRLGLATALLGDPGVLILDEPSNGLDPEGIKWMRTFLRQLAREGRTVLVSSHLLTEIQQTVDALVVIAHGRLVFQGALNELVDPTQFTTVVDSPDRAGLASALKAASVPTDILRAGLIVDTTDPATVGAVAARSGIALSSLQRRGPALEEVFLDLVSGARVHPSGQDSLDAAAAQAHAAEAAAAQAAVTATATGHDSGAAHDAAESEAPLLDGAPQEPVALAVAQPVPAVASAPAQPDSAAQPEVDASAEATSNDDDDESDYVPGPATQITALLYPDTLDDQSDTDSSSDGEGAPATDASTTEEGEQR